MSIRMQQVLDAWALATEICDRSTGGASADEIAEAERILGRALPPAARELYAAHDGGEFVASNLQILPLQKGILALTTASDQYRSWQWPIPPEMVVFGGNGSEATYGLWLHEQSVENALVVEIGEGEDPDTLAIVGDDLASFLAGHSAFYLNHFAMDGYNLEPALDALGVPNSLRRPDDGEDDAYFRFLNWANPGLPDKEPDPNSSRALTPEQVNEIAHRRS